MKRSTAERKLIALALALIGPNPRLTVAERRCQKGILPCADPARVEEARAEIRAGGDPLGDALIRARTPQVRRASGAVYTPAPIVASMMSWAAANGEPRRVVDPGAGSGRFLLAAAKKFPDASLIGIESDPVAALLLRANLAVQCALSRAEIVVEDYRTHAFAPIDGKTLFVGNPPYVRHHAISAEWKTWFGDSVSAFGIKGSKLAGLHIHFFVRTLQLAQKGDYGVFITSAEWLDVNYGATLRKLLGDGLGGVALHVLDASVTPFSDAATTGAITCFRVGERPRNFLVQAVPSLDRLKDLASGNAVLWSEVGRAARWSNIIRPGPPKPAGYVELGEICRVHRGQVTGGNNIWIAGSHAADLPDLVLVPTVTKARDLIAAGDSLASVEGLRKVVNLPEVLDELPPEMLPVVHRFLRWARRQGAHRSYIARHRRAWWSVGLKEPAPIICTYMARRPPAFVRNLCGARHINIAHGLYPREPLADKVLNGLATWLRQTVGTGAGRIYAGGLTKFEPKELERLPVPKLEMLPE